MVKKFRSLVSTHFLPSSELILDVGQLNWFAGALKGRGSLNFLEGGNLGRNLFKGGKSLLLKTNIERVHGDDDKRLEVRVGSGVTTIVNEDSLALVEWVGVVQLEGGVSHVKSRDTLATREVNLLNDEDQSVI